MKEEYRALEIEILKFGVADVIVTSDPEVGDDGLPFIPENGG